MSLPVFATSGTGPNAGAVEAPVVLVHVRVIGQPNAVGEVARQLCEVLHVAEDSADYPRRRDLGVRRYLTVVLVPGAADPGRATGEERTQ